MLVTRPESSLTVIARIWNAGGLVETMLGKQTADKGVSILKYCLIAQADGRHSVLLWNKDQRICKTPLKLSQ